MVQQAWSIQRKTIILSMNEHQHCTTFYTLYFHGQLLYLGCELNDKKFIFHVLN